MFPETEEEFLEALRGDDPTLAATAEAMLWRTWCRSGNSEADRIFRAGVDAMQQSRLEAAENEFTRVIDIAPDFAEGWNKRATVRFMVNLYEKKIYPSVDGIRNVIRLLGANNEKIRRLKAEDLVDDSAVRKLEKEGRF